MSTSKKSQAVEKKTGTVLKTLKDMESLFQFGGEISPFLLIIFTR